MKRIVKLCLLLILPLVLQADHLSDRIEGTWESEYFEQKIKIKVRRHHIKVKGLHTRRWTIYRPTRIGLFVDDAGNTIRIRNIHNLEYRSVCGRDRIIFRKRGHRHERHLCDHACRYHDAHDYFYDRDAYYHDDYGRRRDRDGRDSHRNRSQEDHYDSYAGRSDRYYVREIDEYVDIRHRDDILDARRGSGEWVRYRQNRNRKNEYIDARGNTYLLRPDGDLTWKSANGTLSLNLSPRQ